MQRTVRFGPTLLCGAVALTFVIQGEWQLAALSVVMALFTLVGRV